MNSENTSCPACGRNENKDWGEKNHLGILICKACGTIYTPVDRFTFADYDEMYQEHSRMASVSDFAEQRVREIVQTFDGYRETNQFLDVGSGAGSLLNAAVLEQWDAEGMEVSDSAVRILRDRGLKVFHGLLQDAKYESGRFDVVTASEVIEHVPDPLGFAKEIQRVIRPGGVFWASTPHGRGLSTRLLKERWSQVEPPVHIHLFSLKGISSLLKRAGFSNVRVYSQGTNPFELIHNLRHKVDTENQHNHLKEKLDFVDPVELNASLSKSWWKRMAKDAVNGTLRLSNLGDSIKIIAVK